MIRKIIFQLLSTVLTILSVMIAITDQLEMVQFTILLAIWLRQVARDELL